MFLFRWLYQPWPCTSAGYSCTPAPSRWRTPDDNHVTPSQDNRTMTSSFSIPKTSVRRFFISCEAYHDYGKDSHQITAIIDKRGTEYLIGQNFGEKKCQNLFFFRDLPLFSTISRFWNRFFYPRKFLPYLTQNALTLSDEIEEESMSPSPFVNREEGIGKNSQAHNYGWGFSCNVYISNREPFPINRYFHDLPDARKNLKVEPQNIQTDEAQTITVTCTGAAGLFIDLAWFKDSKRVVADGTSIVIRNTGSGMEVGSLCNLDR